MKRYQRFFELTIILLWLSAESKAQMASFAPYQPSKQEMLANYRRAQLMDSLTKNKVYKNTLKTCWQKGGNAFWYCNTVKDNVREYWLVDVQKGQKRNAFDAEKLASGLSAQLGKSLDARRLLLDSLCFDKNNQFLSFKAEKSYFQCNLNDYTCTKIESLPKDETVYPSFLHSWERWNSFATDSISPDKKWVAFIKNNNILIQPTSGGQNIQFTNDGSTSKPYGALAWSPDSKYIVAYRISPVKDSLVYYIRTDVPNTTRGQLNSQPYKQPGDPFTTFEMFAYRLDTQKAIKIDCPVLDFFEAPKLNWRKNDERYYLFEKVDRGHQRFRIFEVDSFTGQTKTILDEKTDTFMYENRLFTHYLPETNEIVRTSEKDGWRHLYLKSTLKDTEQQITKGNWVVRTIDSIDVKKREIWFSASGMNPEEDPYYIHYYRIGLDGKNLLELTPQKGNHNLSYSPDKRFYIDAYSEVHVPTKFELKRTSDGKKLMTLEQADASDYLATGIRLPEPFHTKGRDGQTDIWGIICRPSKFDSTLKYPVIEQIYAGPQDSFVPKSFMGRYSEMQSMAELGFIVVQIDGMGTANRSKAFHDVCWKNLADAGFPDRIKWIMALAQKYPYVDITRVGLFGTSAGGQNALGGLLFHPEFYKAGVAACGCHDNRVDKQWWNEQWMGYPVGKHYEEQSNVVNAGKLQGNLLLIVGETDTNVPPESTYRVINSLIKAGKTFDFLPIPNMGHSDGGPYGRIRKRDFFVKYLLGIDPPQRNTNELLTDK